MLYFNKHNFEEETIMKYAVVYSSVTNNTKRLAETIKETVGAEFCGKFSDEALEAEVLFIGFWATKHSCGADVQGFMKKLSNKKIFLFGTAGYNDTQEYFEEILSNAKEHIPASNEIIGTYMCQGKVTEAMKNRIKEVMPEKYEEMKDKLASSENHPNQADLDALVVAVEKVIK